MAWHIGDTITLTSTTTDRNGDPSDPTTLTLYVEDPSGNVDTYTLAGGDFTKVSTGIYRRDVLVDEAGEWDWRWKSTGTPTEADQGSFIVLAKNIPSAG